MNRKERRATGVSRESNVQPIRRLPLIAFGIPTGPVWSPVMGRSLVDCAMYSATQIMMISPIQVQSCYVEVNRNSIVDIALSVKAQTPEGERELDYLLWIDTDMLFPADTLVRLLKHNKDIVGANYRARSHPFGYIGLYEDLDDSHVHDEGLQPMRNLGGGLMLVKMDVYRNMSKPFYEATTTGPRRDELWFCHEARKAGYTIWCDNDLTREVAHLGDLVLGWYPPGETPAKHPLLNVAKNEEAA